MKNIKALFTFDKNMKRIIGIEMKKNKLCIGIKKVILIFLF